MFKITKNQRNVDEFLRKRAPIQVIVLVPRGSQKVEKLKKLENDETMSKIAVLPAWELISKKSRNLILGSNW